MKAFVFDIDNTLYDFDAAYAAVDYARQAPGLPAGAFDALRRQSGRMPRVHTGSVCTASEL